MKATASQVRRGRREIRRLRRRQGWVTGNDVIAIAHRLSPAAALDLLARIHPNGRRTV